MVEGLQVLRARGDVTGRAEDETLSVVARLLDDAQGDLTSPEGYVNPDHRLQETGGETDV